MDLFRKDTIKFMIYQIANYAILYVFSVKKQLKTVLYVQMINIYHLFASIKNLVIQLFLVLIFKINWLNVIKNAYNANKVLNNAFNVKLQ